MFSNIHRNLILYAVLPLLTGCVPWSHAYRVPGAVFDASRICDKETDRYIVFEAKNNNKFLSRSSRLLLEKESGPGIRSTSTECIVGAAGVERKTISVVVIPAAGSAHAPENRTHYLMVKFPGGEIYGFIFESELESIYRAEPGRRFKKLNLKSAALPFLITVRNGRVLELSVRSIE